MTKTARNRNLVGAVAALAGAVVVVGAAAALALAGLTGCSGGSDRPSIILITVDTLRADHLGCYGYARDTSPGIDAFASDALLFENCYSHAPETRTSFSSILSGFLPHETRVVENIPVPEQVTTLPEILKENGYRTAAVIGNYALRRKMGFAQGFDVFDDTMQESEVVRHLPERTAENTADRAIELLREMRDDTFFLWVHFQDPHGPYTPVEPYDRMFADDAGKKRDLKINKSLTGRGGIPMHQVHKNSTDFYHYIRQYDGEIRFFDDHFKRVIDELKSAGLYDDSLIVFTSDHGEGMGEHDYYFAHIEYLYKGITHVPLIVRHGPGTAGRNSAYVKHIDIVPTVLRIAGIEHGAPYQGTDLLLPHETKGEIYAEMMQSPLTKGKMQYSLIIDGLKLVHYPAADMYALYDLDADPGENHNLINDAQYVDKVAALKTRLNELRRQDLLRIGAGAGEAYEPSEEELRKLRALGYGK